MASNLLATYILEVYDDGRLVVKMAQTGTQLGGCSSSIRQIVKIAKYVKDTMDKNPTINIHRPVVDAVNRVALEEDVAVPTIHAKITRKLGMSMAEFKAALADSIKNKAPNGDPFFNELRNAVVTKNYNNDMKVIADLESEFRK